jgi:mono/diheme cytochrome c family protein
MNTTRVLVLCATAALVAACAMTRSLAPAEPPSRASFDAALIEKGARLSAIGNCASCHTVRGGKAYAGGRPLETPFGTIHGTNITPDPETGIGRWSAAAFRRAMREGVDRDGRHLYPVFPYDHFTRVTDDDLHALYAYFMTREPVHAEPPPNTVSFPFNVRSLIGAWKLLYFEPGVFQPDPARSAQWNRGAYLAEGLAHCSACHTPRNRLGAEIKRALYDGGEAGGWHAPALNANNPAPVPWNAEQLYRYLRTGLDDAHAIAAGPMTPVVRNLARVPEEDVRAIAAYFADMAGPPSPERRKKAEEAMAHAKRDQARGPRTEIATPKGAAVYAGACATCHDQGRQASSGTALHLALGTAVTAPTPSNLIRITLQGITPGEDSAGRRMPGFGEALTDEQVRDLVHYLRAEFGRAPPWHDVDVELKKARESARTP